MKLESLPDIGLPFLWQEPVAPPIYAGLSIENDHPVALILLPGELPLTNWKDAAAWAEKQGGTLPSRIDLFVLFKNLKSKFKEEWYWSSELLASAASYAWVQLFGNGSQVGSPQSHEYHARAVRRIKIDL